MRVMAGADAMQGVTVYSRRSIAQFVTGSDRGTASQGGPAAPLSSQALEAAYHTERRRLFAYLRRSVGTDEAADLVQEVFARAAGAGNFAEIVDPRPYLMKIARNLLLNRWRAQTRAGAQFCPFDEEQMPIAQPDQFWWIEAADLLAAYQRAIKAMRPRTRQVFLMRRADQFTQREIADELGLGIRGVEAQMRRALAICERALSAYRCKL